MQGILMPVPTLFKKDGSVDIGSTLDIIDDSIKAGVHALFILGSAGQGPVMELDERAAAADAMIKHVKGRLPVLVNVGTAYLKTSVQLAEAAVASGADAIAATPPYYYADHPAAEVDAHLAGVAKATGGRPFVLYNNLRYTGIEVTAPWLAQLAEKIPNLAGVKLSYVSQSGVFQYLDKVPNRVAIYIASILELLSTVPFGAKGCINPPSVFFPELPVAMWNALMAKDYTRAFELQKAVKISTLGLQALERKYGRYIIAEGMRLRGYKVEQFPRWAQGEPIDDKVRSEVKGILETIKKILGS
jgi:4-hydroxy-tetrahydrodipicolinate synthase